MIWDEHAYLMVDSAIIAQEEGTSMVREESFKHADNPIIHADRKEFFLGQPGYSAPPVYLGLESIISEHIW